MILGRHLIFIQVESTAERPVLNHFSFEQTARCEADHERHWSERTFSLFVVT